MTDITCPFGACTARLTLDEQRAIDLGTPAISTIPVHPTLPDAWFGECPASGMGWPTSETERGMLREQRAVYEAAWSARVNDSARREHILTPKPDKNPQWFRNSDGDPNGGGQPVRTPRLRLVPEPDSAPVPDPAPEPERPKLTLVQGGSMATVAEVRAALGVANDSINEALGLINTARERADEALAQVNFVRASSVDPLGAPMISDAIEQLNETTALLSAAIEANDTYRGTL